MLFVRVALPLAEFLEMVECVIFGGSCGWVVAFGRTWFAVGMEFDETLSARPHVAVKLLSLVGEVCWDRKVGTDVALAPVTFPLLAGRLGLLPRGMDVFVTEAASLSLPGVGDFGSSTWRAVWLSRATSFDCCVALLRSSCWVLVRSRDGKVEEGS